MAGCQEAKCTVPVICSLKLKGIDVSITYLTLLVYREWNSIMELTYPVWITFLEDTGNDKDEVASHLSTLKFPCLYGIFSKGE